VQNTGVIEPVVQIETGAVPARFFQVADFQRVSRQRRLAWSLHPL